MKRYKEEQDWLNYRVGLICAVIANAHRDPKKHKPFGPKDFMPKQEREKETKRILTADQMTERIKMINVALGGKSA